MQFIFFLQLCNHWDNGQLKFYVLSHVPKLPDVIKSSFLTFK